MNMHAQPPFALSLSKGDILDMSRPGFDKLSPNGKGGLVL